MASYYVRTSGGNNGNDGLSVAQGWATIAYAETLAVAGDIVHLCMMASDETFTPAADITFDQNGNDVSGAICWTGANSSGQLDGTVAVVDGSSSSTSVFTITGDRQFFRDIRIKDAPGNAEGWTITGAAAITLLRCESNDNGGSGFLFNGGTTETVVINCLVDSSDSIGFFTSGSTNNRITLYGCVCIGDPFVSSDGFLDFYPNTVYINCLSYRNAAGFTGYHFVNCTAYECAGDGFKGNLNTPNAYLFQNCLAVNNGNYGFSPNQRPALFVNCAHFGNTSGFRNGSWVGEMEIGTVALSADPCRNPDNKDFSLNNHPQGGALCRGGGSPTSFINTNTSTTVDIGCYYPAIGRRVSG